MATAKLRLTRRFGGVLTKHDWDVQIDGKVVGSIAYRRTVEFRVAPGHHTLRLGSKRQVSPERSFDIAKGEVVSFWCRSVLFWPVMVAAFFKKELWINLRPE